MNILFSSTTTTIWGGSVLTSEEPPPHSGELKHDFFQVGGPALSMEHRLRRKHLLLNPDTNARGGMYVEKIKKKEKEKMKNWENEKHEKMKKKEKEALKEVHPPRRLKKLIFERNVVRTRQAIEA